MAAKLRVNVEITFPDREEAIRLGMRRLLDEWAHLGTASAVLTCVTKQDLKGFIGHALGQIGNDLLKNGVATFSGLPGRQLRFAHKQMLPSAGEGMPILAIWPTAEVLTALDALPNIGALIVVPLNDQDTQDWRDARQPEVAGPARTGILVLSPAPILARALDGLLAVLDHTRAILDHDMDKAIVIQTFRALRSAQIPYEPRTVRAYLARHGLNPLQADEIRRISMDPDKVRMKAKVKTTDELIRQWTVEE